MKSPDRTKWTIRNRSGLIARIQLPLKASNIYSERCSKGEITSSGRHITLMSAIPRVNTRRGCLVKMRVDEIRKSAGNTTRRLMSSKGLHLKRKFNIYLKV